MSGLEDSWNVCELRRSVVNTDLRVTMSRSHDPSRGVTRHTINGSNHSSQHGTADWRLLLVVCHFPIFPTLHKRTFLRIINNFIKHIRYKAALVRARRYSDGDRWWQCSSVCSILLMSKDFINWHKIGNLFALLNVDIFCCIIIAPAFHLGVKCLVCGLAEHKAWQVTKQK